ncbi:MAG: type I DNA topoisomerase [Candidatus Omnitrophica bacterium]|nr:type I DNA topoisomerase [Candidatus Omnitrophota bacterium]
MPAKRSQKENNSKYLVIVESPAKSKTINKILGKDYKVLASMGHIIDLPDGKMGIDFENGFQPEYVVMKGRKKYLTNLKKEAKKSDAIFLAADPDREGEAICWHLKNQFSKNTDRIYRVSFGEITAKAVEEAFKHPGKLDMKKVNAQQARRVLDRIVGYSLSPLLWGKVTRGLSAGRVQSVAVRLICERENDIRNFKTREYWSIDALLRKTEEMPEGSDGPPEFKAKLVKHKDEKIEIGDRGSADAVVEELREQKFTVEDIKKKKKKSHPRSPYTTSVMQQDAFNKLNFSANKTMRTAQGLYEGVELGEEGSVGLITYMRTDSVRISNDASEEVRKFIKEQYGDKYCPSSPPKYKSKKRAQEGHEAIRPTLPLRPPATVEKYLSPDEYKLYNLIWKRFLSSQMESALYSLLAVHIKAGDYKFHAGGGQLLFDGFLKVYREDGDDQTETSLLPPLEKGEETALVELFPEQHFTKPPARYTDASLVKELEEKGIGRPSTYAPIIRTIINRNYIKRMGRSLQPTELGELVNKLLVENFPDVVDDAFTARMEDELDEIEEGKIEWHKALEEFYSDFSKKLEEAKEKMKSVKKQEIKTDEKCSKCGRPMVIKWGRRGRFLSCSGFPSCKESKSITTGVKCPEEECDGELVERRSKRGMFYGCTRYPKCTYTSRKLPQEDPDKAEKQDQVEGE